MNTGYFKIAEQIGNYGFYGEIEIECRVTNKYRELELVLDSEFERWRPGILFGAIYFLEHCTDRLGLFVQVKNIRYHEVDTNSTVLAYLTFRALSDATKLKLKSEVLFDKESKSFIFPK